MSGTAPDPTTPDDRGSRNLLLRIGAAAVLIPLAIAAAWAGGWVWFILVVLVAAGLFVEWMMIVGAVRPLPMAAGLIGLGLAGLALMLGRFDLMVGILVAGLVATALVSRDLRGWTTPGVLYAATALLAALALRRDETYGFTALMFVLVVVWVTDIGGYVAGRGIGGPKLWPRVSPKKTWAGALGGFGASLVVAAGFALGGAGRMLPLLLLGAGLTIASQLGDLFESAVKRRFGVKDSSQIIPGHGGLLDRLDGFVFAVALAAAIGLVRGGGDGVGRGLMVW